jgi:ubiquinone/menaquinone biosynthesis C-methylase UbiE
MNSLIDVPSPIDLRQPKDAAEWERTAIEKRPWRTEFFQCFAEQIRASRSGPTVLELGSGPGFLAEHLLAANPAIHMVLLDFSTAMHDMARARLAQYLNRVSFIERSFKDTDWSMSIGTFDFVATNQAVHELRHKRYAVVLHQQVRAILTPNGRYLVSDHYAGKDGMRNTDLYMTIEEQQGALREAGYTSIVEIKRKGGMVLHSAA